jgi:hypothetical protein
MVQAQHTTTKSTTISFLAVAVDKVEDMAGYKFAIVRPRLTDATQPVL